MVKHTLKILQQMLQDLLLVFVHFIDTKCHQVKRLLRLLKAYVGPCQIYMAKLAKLAKIVNELKPLNIFTKRFNKILSTMIPPIKVSGLKVHGI